MFGSIKCMFSGHVFSFTKEYLDRNYPANDNAISCRCLRCDRYFEMITGDARKIAHKNPKLKLVTAQEVADYCYIYLQPVRYVAGRPVFRQKDVDTLHIQYPEHFKQMFED